MDAERRALSRQFVQVGTFQPRMGALWAVDGLIYEIIHVEPRVHVGGERHMQLAGYDIYLASTHTSGPIELGAE